MERVSLWSKVEMPLWVSLTTEQLCSPIILNAYALNILTLINIYIYTTHINFVFFFYIYS